MNAANENSTAPTESIRFPALGFSQGLINVVTSLDRQECTKLGFKSGYFKKLFYIDSNSSRFNVVGAKKIRTLFDFSIRDFFNLLGFNPRWEIQLTLGPPSTTSLDKVKDLVASSFKKEQDFWEEMSDFEEFEGKIAKAQSIDQVFSVFKEFNQW